ncbi:hypothetical protein EPR50_G00126990 [Perca flavescens]|uniref:Uncharacterized protein n=1 Tax=Perca flavescens TaxID=8167 RepID=A0A484CQP6_PERFV|nr:hypothetical protein EPR50_G00126990 [Perca flavescens]
MPCVRAVRQWEIRPTSALWGIRRTRALMWQRLRGVVRTCRHSVGYSMNYNDPVAEEQEMVCLELSSRLFYGERDTVVVPVNPARDNDSSEEEDNDVADPNFLPRTHNLDIDGPSAKRKCVRPAVEVLVDEALGENYGNQELAPTAKRPTNKRKPEPRKPSRRRLTWTTHP